MSIQVMTDRTTYTAGQFIPRDAVFEYLITKTGVKSMWNIMYVKWK